MDLFRQMWHCFSSKIDFYVIIMTKMDASHLSLLNCIFHAELTDRFSTWVGRLAARLGQRSPPLQDI